ASVEVFERTNYDLNVLVSPSDASLGIDISYNTNNYDASAFKRLAYHFDRLIHEFTESPDRPLSTINYLSDDERHELLHTFNDTQVAYPRDKTIVDLFEEQVSRTPDSVAL